MKTIQQLYHTLDGIAPFDTACGFDHCGLLVGDQSSICGRIGVVLDVTPTTLKAAKEQGCSVVVSHHPVIFHPLATLAPHSMPYQLVTAGMACIAMHTNWDKAKDGVNDAVASCCGLTQIETPVESDGLARVGLTETPTAISDFVNTLKQGFDAPMIRYYDSGKPVHRVLTVAGSGADFLELAVALGADTLVTGDIKHDRFVEAQCRQLNVIELNHGDAERVGLPALVQKLQDAGWDAVLLESASALTVG